VHSKGVHRKEQTEEKQKRINKVSAYGEKKLAKFFVALKIIHAVLFRISTSDLSHDILLYNPYAYNISFTSKKCGCSEGE
jgi:hypothetical protein